MACSHAGSALVHVAVTVHVINLQFVFESYSPIAGSVSWVFVWCAVREPAQLEDSLGSGGFSLRCTL